MALFAHKTMQFVRAPDENVFIARQSTIPPLGCAFMQLPIKNMPILPYIEYLTFSSSIQSN